MIDKQKSWLYVLELSVGFEAKIKDKQRVCKRSHYSNICSELRKQYNRVRFVNISMEALEC